MVIDFRKLNKATRKDHYPLHFINQMLERLSNHTHFCFLDGYSGFSQIHVSQPDQEKTTFTCPFGTYAYRRMPFVLCNAQESLLWLPGRRVARRAGLVESTRIVYPGSGREDA